MISFKSSHPSDQVKFSEKELCLYVKKLLIQQKKDNYNIGTKYKLQSTYVMSPDILPKTKQKKYKNIILQTNKT